MAFVKAALGLAVCLLTAPVSAQFYWQPFDTSGAAIQGYEPGMGSPLPGATAAEQRAAIVWNMRSALNVAALQCGFEPTLRSLENYNAILGNHGAELTASFNTLTAYFRRTNKTAALGQKALDTYGTRTYAGFSTVQSQLEFCGTAGRIGRIALFTPRGSFHVMASEHLRTVRNSLLRTGEQQFRFGYPRRITQMPIFSDERCWKKNKYTRACGYL
jgi:hypothetical protein